MFYSMPVVLTVICSVFCPTVGVNHSKQLTQIAHRMLVGRYE